MQYVFLGRSHVRPKVTSERPTRQRTQHSTIFLDMWEVVARSVGDLEGVLGFEVGITDVLPRVISIERMLQMMNEPHRGYIQIPSLHAFDYNTDLHLSHVRKSISLATHASLNLLRSVHLPILPVGCWPPYPRFHFQGKRQRRHLTNEE